jgi:hypothetical protein
MNYRQSARAFVCWATAAATAGLAGCSVHPLPQDVAPRASTVQIVSRIRCEAREGLEAALLRAQAQGGLAGKHVAKIVEGTTIGFEFKFVMAETNSAKGGELVFQRKDLEDVGFKLVLLGDINGGHDDGDNSTRRNTRVFRVVDELGDLRDARCGASRRMGAAPNLVYPITGSTGMAEVVRTYIELEQLTDLAADEKEIVTFSDKLDFTTTLEVGAIPNLELDTAVGSLKLIKASIAGSSLRKDFHSVTVVLARQEASRRRLGVRKSADGGEDEGWVPDQGSARQALAEFPDPKGGGRAQSDFLRAGAAAACRRGCGRCHAGIGRAGEVGRLPRAPLLLRQQYR